MKNIKRNKWWYVVVVVLLIIWVLIVLVAGIYNLILNELNSNKQIWNYIKTLNAAEWSKELALLKIKQNGYGYYKYVTHDVNEDSIIFSETPIDTSGFNNNKEVLISYDIWSKTNNYNWFLAPLWYDIVPLFYTDDNWEYKLSEIDLTLLSWNGSDLVWNIIWKNDWISWTSVLNEWEWKTNSLNWFQYNKQNIKEFLNNSDLNYLVLFNTSKVTNIEYNLKSVDNSEYFSKPETEIISSAQIWEFKQNIRTKLDNTEFLHMLKYSIYSN